MIEVNAKNILHSYGISAQRIANIQVALNKICAFSNCKVLDVDYVIAQKFYEFLKQGILSKTYKPSYVSQIMLNLKFFYHFLWEHSDVYELERSKYPCLKHGNPFEKINIENYNVSEYHENDFPSLQQIDLLLRNCEDEKLHAAVQLAFNNCLSLHEIVTLKKNNIVMDTSNHSVFLELPLARENQKIRQLQIDDSLAGRIDALMNSTSKEYPYVFFNTHGKPLTNRTAEISLKKLVSSIVDLNYPITFSILRICGIRNLISQGAPIEKVAEYTNSDGRWLYRYINAGSFNIVDINDFQKILIK